MPCHSFFGFVPTDFHAVLIIFLPIPHPPPHSGSLFSTLTNFNNFIKHNAFFNVIRRRQRQWRWWRCIYLSIYTETPEHTHTHKQPKTIVRAPMYTHNREIMVGSLLSIRRLIACLHLASTELLFVTWKLCQNGDDGNNSSKKRKKVEGFFRFCLAKSNC